jgi:hypothetical protein
MNTPPAVLGGFAILIAISGLLFIFGRKAISRNMPSDKAAGRWGLSARALLATGVLLMLTAVGLGWQAVIGT